MLSSKQIESYNTNGYLAVENVLAAQELSALRALTDAFVERSRAVTAHNSVFDLEQEHTAAAPSLRRIKHPVAQDPGYARFTEHDKILDIVTDLLGSNVRYHNNKLNMKNPAGGAAVEWHQDWAFYPHTNDDILEVGIALDDMTMENGPLMVIPGSHRAGRKPRPGETHWKGREAQPVLCEAGDVLLFRSDLWHTGSRNRTTDRSRQGSGFCSPPGR